MKYPHSYKSFGEYRHYHTCRFCFSEKLSPVINLGNVPLAGGFLKSSSDIKSEKLYPLEISFCENCYLLQSINVIAADTLFKDYFYHSSVIKTLTNHFKEAAQEIDREVQKNDAPLVLEIGSNDGTLIMELIRRTIPAIGIDPATNIVAPLIKKGLPFINDYFTDKVAKIIKKDHGCADVIFSSNTMAHIEDMHEIMNGITTVLKKDGMLIFEVHYLGNLLQEMQYDMIYHEHQYYYSLLTLQKFFAMHKMEVFDVKPISIHAGSMRYYVQSKNHGIRKVSKNVAVLLKEERRLKYDKVETYISYEKKVTKTKTDLIKLLKQLKTKNKTIVGYGASGRGTILMNYCSLDTTYLDYVIDDAPAKQGAFTPGTHLQIVPSNILSAKAKKQPDYIVLFAWAFLEEIKIRQSEYLTNGGKFIIPLPKVAIIP